MATAQINKVVRIGGSPAIVLPSQWAKGKMKAGDEMALVGNGGLHIFAVSSNADDVEQGGPQK